MGSPPWEKKHRSISMGWGTALILYPVLGEGMSMIAFLCYFYSFLLYSLLDKSSGTLSVNPHLY